MATIAQLRAEPWWDREVITPELDWCGDELCRRTGAAASSIGTKGDVGHLNGGHRSQEWIVNSDWCTNTHYTVQSGLTADQMRHIAALDRTPGAWGTSANRARMVLETGRLVAAARAGKLVGVTQVQGTLDGTKTYGQNFPSLITTVPSDSHLDHWHLTFDRRYLRDAALMQRIVDVALGEEDDVALSDNDAKYLIWRIEALANMEDTIQGGPEAGAEVKLVTAVKKLLAKPAVQPAPVDAAALKAVLLDPTVLAAIAKAVTNEIGS